LFQKSKPTHECGVFAIFGHPDAASIVYYGLFALQHRGQESAGIVSAKGSEGPFAVHKGMGLVSQVFTSEALERVSGTRAIGHVRYSTTGSSTIKNAQPFVVDTGRGQIAVAHNGNLSTPLFSERNSSQRLHLQTTVDSEIILHLLAQPRGSGGVLSALRRIEARSRSCSWANADPRLSRSHGFRPSASAGKTAHASSRRRVAPWTN
jgi:amidophosphoribosyltransferase